ncbi:hypothetical protein QQF64_020538 [Cirrhinus molitorella]|uniref:Nidogen and EGF-like domain-containing n=1 Tax=Cirrhinus molitorella TaxID=172907 RepID=A0ABR3L9K2_9TELE
MSLAPSSFLPFGVGDTLNPILDDGTSQAISLQQPFKYFGSTYDQIFVNNNGHLTFTEPLYSYNPILKSNRDIIAPLWTDLDNRHGGTISYREDTSSALLAQVTAAVKEYFPDVTFAATSAFVATWDSVPYYNGGGVNNNGYLTFTEKLSAYNPYLDFARDIIAPLWTHLDNRHGGTVSYREDTSSAVLAQVTGAVKQYFPNIPFAAATAFVATWDSVPYYNGGGVVSFQVVLAYNVHRSFILIYYGDIAETGQPWQAGYNTVDSVNSFTIPGASVHGLSLSSNINATACWSFHVDGSPILPANFLPFGNGEIVTLRLDNGSSEAITLQQSFKFFGRTHNQTFVNNNGHLTFTERLSDYIPLLNSGKDIIAPLWTHLDNRRGGTVSCREDTSSALLAQVTAAVKQYFPNVTFAASSAFVATWDSVPYYNGGGVATFQVVLVSSVHRSFILLNYGHISETEQIWQAGYSTVDSVNSFTIPVTSAPQLSSSSNINVNGRCSFHVDGAPNLPTNFLPSGDEEIVNPPADDGSSGVIFLQQPFKYFGRTYNQIFVNNNGYLTFTEPLSAYNSSLDSARDIIAPLWTRLDNRHGGTVSYREDTSSAVLAQVTGAVKRYFPNIPFDATTAFVATWDSVPYHSGGGLASFQVVLAYNVHRSFILIYYGDIAETGQPWQAGYNTVDSVSSFTIPAASVPELSSSSNINVTACWSFHVDGSPFLPANFLPFGNGEIVTPRLENGSSGAITLQQPFKFFGRTHNQTFVNNDGHLTFTEPLSDFIPLLNSGRDIIAPLWTHLDNRRGGTISCREDTSSAALAQVTAAVQRYFPNVTFAATSAFVATWDSVPYYNGRGVATFQVVLVSSVHRSFILLNYGHISETEQIWQAGYSTVDSVNSFTIPVTSAPQLSSSSNINVNGRCSFHVDGAPNLPTNFLPSGDEEIVNPPADDGSSGVIFLQQPFKYFGRTYNQIFVNNNGYLTFTEPLSAYNSSLDSARDIIAPLWTRLDNRHGGTVSYREETSSAVLAQVTGAVKQYFPNIPFDATTAFVATWDSVPYHSGGGLASFQVVLAYNVHRSFILIYYGDIAETGQPWQAGYNTVDSVSSFTIPAASVPELSSSSNINVTACWSFHVDGSPFLPANFLPFGNGEIVTPRLENGSSGAITLQQPFKFFGRTHNQTFVNNDGHLTFTEPLSDFIPLLNSGRDIIAPLWTHLDNRRGGTISCREDTSSAVLAQVTAAVQRYFPNVTFAATSAFVATWDSVPYYNGRGVATFQVVLVSSVHRSFILLNYGHISETEQIWQAGYSTVDSVNSFTIPVTSAPQLSSSSNINVNGRCSFHVDGAPNLPTNFLPSGDEEIVNPPADDGSSGVIFLQQPFKYFGRTYNQIFVNNNGYLTFTEPLSAYNSSLDSARDIIAPLWTRLDNRHGGTVSYKEETSSAVLAQVTGAVKQYFPNIPFDATTAFVATWDSVPYHSGGGLASFQVVLAYNVHRSFILIYYGDIAETGQPWQAGYNTVDSVSSFTIPAASVPELSSSSNINVTACWSFHVDGSPFLPANFLPFGNGEIVTPRLENGSSGAITLQQPFKFFGRTHNQTFVNNDGHLTFTEPLSDFIPLLNSGRDIIAPLWTHLDNRRGGTISCREDTSSAVLAQVTAAVQRYFPNVTFAATSAFVATWDSVPYYNGRGVATFQVVLVSSVHRSFILLNYGHISETEQIWQAGYSTVDSVNSFTIPVTSAPQLSSSSNINVNGRCSFHVDGAPNLPTNFLPSGDEEIVNPPADDGSSGVIFLQQPFKYFGRTYNQIFVNNNGYLTFTEPLSAYNSSLDSARDIIAPLWTRLDNRHGGTVSYREDTSSAVLAQVTGAVKQYFPNIPFDATTAFVATWDSVPYHSGGGLASFQVVLAYNVHRSFILIYYGDIAETGQPWQAGYNTVDSVSSFTIPAASVPELSSSSNINVTACWSFHVDGSPFLPANFLPFGNGEIVTPRLENGSSGAITLQQPFKFFGRTHNQTFVNNDGHLTFTEPLSDFIPLLNSGRDIIAPLWTHLDNRRGGTISCREDTSSAVLAQVTAAVQRYFPNVTFAATSAFVATWDSVPYYNGRGVATFQVVLVSSVHRSFILLNYGHISETEQIWQAGYSTVDSVNSFTIPVTSAPQLSSSSNINVNGRCSFHVDGAPNLPTNFLPSGDEEIVNPPADDGSSGVIFLQQPFKYFGRTYNQIFVNNNGYLTFTEPLSAYNSSLDSARDIIAPLWTRLDNRHGGTVSYREETSSAVLAQVTGAVKQYFPNIPFDATTAFVATWDSVPYHSGGGLASFQVVLAYNVHRSFILIYYGDIAETGQPWQAGYNTVDSVSSFTIPAASVPELSSSSNINVTACWSFHVDGSPFLPANFLPFGNGEIVTPRLENGSSGAITLQQPFKFFGRTHNQTFVNNDGHLTFTEPLSDFIPLLNSGRDIIAPLWTHLDNRRGGTISCREDTSSAALAQVTAAVQRYFPNVTFAATSAFVATWDSVPYYNGRGVATFQVVLVSSVHRSFILLNYGHISETEQIWQAGYSTVDSVNSFTIPVTSAPQLSSSSNINVNGRCSFHVDGAPNLPTNFLPSGDEEIVNPPADDGSSGVIFLQQPFKYFGRTYNQIFVNNNGYLTFTEPLSAYNSSLDSARDIIAPLWTRLDNRHGGTVSYREDTSSAVLAQVTGAVKQYFPNIPFDATTAFVATWDSVPYHSGGGLASFQVVLAYNVHRSFILIYYGDIAETGQPWQAGYNTVDSVSSFTIPAASVPELSSSSNINVTACWSFHVDGSPFLPANFLPFGNGEIVTPRLENGSSGAITLQQPFKFFGRTHNQTFVNNDGHLTFTEPLSDFIPLLNSGRDIIAPLWTHLDNRRGGTISCREDTSSAALAQVTAAVQRYFPNVTFAATSAFVATWDSVPYYNGRGVATFQVVLVSSVHRSFILLNYGHISETEQIWQAGYSTVDSVNSFTIPVTSAPQLSSSSNINVNGRCSFHVDGAPNLPTNFLPSGDEEIVNPPADDGSSGVIFLQQPFKYFGRTYNQIFVNNNGYLTFTEPLSAYNSSLDSARDIIAPLWTRLDNRHGGTVSYREDTSSAVLAQVTGAVKQYFPNIPFDATTAFVATWDSVPYHSGGGAGYSTVDSVNSFTIPVTSAPQLSSSSNINVNGRCSFHVDGAPNLPTNFLPSGDEEIVNPPADDGSSGVIFLQQPFKYFGRTYNQIFVNNNGYLTFTEPLSAYNSSLDSARDIIAPLWTRLDNRHGGTVSYREDTSSAVLAQVTGAVKQYFPNIPFDATTAFVATWDSVPYHSGGGLASFQVVLAYNVHRSFILIYYGDIAETGQPWQAGYNTVDSVSSFTIPAASVPELSSSSNINVTACWSFHVDGSPFLPANFLPFGNGEIVTPRLENGSSGAITLQQPFKFFGRTHNQTFVNNDGHLTFTEPLSDFIPLLNSGRDIIAPLWTHLDNRRGGTISCREDTSSAALAQVTAAVQRYFPNVTFAATSAFVATWDSVPYYNGRGVATFQVVLVSSVHRSFILLNYGHISETEQIWQAGYSTVDSVNSFTIPVTSAPQLSSSSNINVNGRCSFHVDGAPNLPTNFLPSGDEEIVNPPADDGSSGVIFLQQPFKYFGRTYNQIFVNNNGYLTFTEPLSAYNSSLDSARDIIAPLWTRLDNRHGGTVSYREDTSSAVLAQVTGAVKQYFPNIPFDATTAFVATWDSVPYHSGGGLASFQVVLAYNVHRSFILIYYGDIAETGQPWQAGYNTVDSVSSFTIPAASVPELSSSSNINVTACWSFHVDGSPFLPANFLPFGNGEIVTPRLENGSSGAITLQQPFKFFGRTHNQTFVNNDGHLTFTEPLSDFIPLLNSGRDIIAPLWTHLDNRRGGTISCREDTSSAVLAQVTAAVQRYFPNVTFAATSAFVATWDSVPYYNGRGVATFQVVLVSSVHRSFILLNYGHISETEQIWQAGYSTVDSVNSFTIPVTSAPQLSSSSNINVNGRCSFHVDGAPNLPTNFLPSGDEEIVNPPADDGSSGVIFLQQPFKYFGRTYNQIFVNNNGYLTFTEPLSAYNSSLDSARDIIAPLWTRLDNRHGGTVSYREDTSSAVLAQVTGAVKQYFPNIPFDATTAFVATWDSVPYHSGGGLASFQVVLAYNVHRSFILIYYGDIAETGQPWQAGYSTVDSVNSFTIPVTSAPQLSSSSNINVNGRCSFHVDGAPNLPTNFLPSGDEEIVNPPADDGSSGVIFLQQPFKYFGRTYNQIFVNNNGYLTFTEPLSAYNSSLDSARDIIAPLWTRLDNRHGGTVSYREDTSSAVLAQVTGAVKQYFPNIPFDATTAFVATWDSVPYHSGGGLASFQVVLAYNVHRSFILIYYGDIAETGQPWQVNNDGHLTFTEPLSDFIPLLNSGRDIIAPLWTHLDNRRGGTISCREDTSSAVLAQVTAAVQRYFPNVTFAATSAFVATWDSVPYYNGRGVATFQVVLVSSVHRSFILLNYGHISETEQIWQAGYSTVDSVNSFTIPVTSAPQLSSSSNINVNGRCSFHVDGAPNLPTNFLPSGDEEIVNPPADDGSSGVIFLQQPFKYFGRTYNQIFVNNNGYLTFTEPLSAYNSSLDSARDIIAPLWTRLDNRHGGTVSYREDTSSAVLAQVTGAVKQYFPNIPFDATTAFVATWDSVPYHSGGGLASFQVVLAYNVHRSFILIYYGDIAETGQPWQAGYNTVDSVSSFTIPAASVPELSSSSNINVTACWSFHVDGSPFLPANFLPFGNGEIVTPRLENGSSGAITLQQPFKFFGRTHNQTFVNNNGYLTFTETLSTYILPLNSGQDIIAPFWTWLDNRVGGTISYRVDTSSAVLAQVTAAVQQYFPNLLLPFTATSVFVATWDSVSYTSGEGVVTFQVVLTSNGDHSFILFNYGILAETRQRWLTHYETVDFAHSYNCSLLTVSELSSNSNVNVNGRWVFHVYDVCDTLDCHGNEVCHFRDGYGCGCLEGERPNPETFDAMEFCAGSTGTISLSRCQLFESGFPPEILHLNDPNCKGISENGRVLFHFDNEGHVCGSTLSSNGTHFIYQNTIQSTFPTAVITRERWINISFSCAYPLIQTLSMPKEIHAEHSVLSIDLPSWGTYQIRMIPYHDAQFIIPYEGNVEVQVNQQMYVEVEVEGVDRSQIATVLDNCWATPVNDIDYQIRWNLIVRECPNPEDGTVEVLRNGIDTSSRFSFRMFTFTRASDQIFLHCQMHLCLVQNGRCAQSCNPGQRRRRRRYLDFHHSAAITMGLKRS